MAVNNNNKKGPLRHALLIGGITFILAIIFSQLAQNVISAGHSIILSIVLLLLIIFIGIAADVVGTAVTAASEAPLHAKAANRIRGAQQAIKLVRNADKVANICNDVIGDIVGTLSGALGGAVVMQMLIYDWSLSQTIMTTLATGIIAALTVGGKAYGKRFAIENAEKIIYMVGWVISVISRNGQLKKKDK